MSYAMTIETHTLSAQVELLSLNSTEIPCSMAPGRGSRNVIERNLLRVLLASMPREAGWRSTVGNMLTMAWPPSIRSAVHVSFEPRYLPSMSKAAIRQRTANGMPWAVWLTSAISVVRITPVRRNPSVMSSAARRRCTTKNIPRTA